MGVWKIDHCFLLQVQYLYSVMSKVGFVFASLELGVPAVILARSGTLDSHKLDAGIILFHNRNPYNIAD